MPSFNKVILAGHLTRDIETRPVGDSIVGHFGLAVNKKFKDKSGQQREEVTFVDCEAWGRSAETMAQYLSKGSAVLIEGELRLDQWQDKDGGNRSKLKVRVFSFQFLDGKGGGDPPSRGGRREVIEESDIPF